jgi:hypothetical protein
LAIWVRINRAPVTEPEKCGRRQVDRDRANLDAVRAVDVEGAVGADGGGRVARRSLTAALSQNRT